MIQELQVESQMRVMHHSYKPTSKPSTKQNNNMTFNNKKLELLRYGNNESLKEETTYLCPDGSPIPEKSHVRDLGVTMSDTGTFNEHINIMCGKARDMCSWVLRTFKSRSPVTMQTLWKSLVLPILDYCSKLWCPIKPGHIQQWSSKAWQEIKKLVGATTTGIV